MLGVSWFLTDAHVMWGGNALSTISGMVAQAWAMPLVVLAASFFLLARSIGWFGIPAAVCGLCAVLSHFYAAIFLALFIVSFFVVDLIAILRRQEEVSSLLAFYGAALCAAVAASFWYFPLVLNLNQSSDFGGHWDISLLETYSNLEKVVFSLSVVLSLYVVIFTAAARRIAPFLLLLTLSLSLFFGSSLTETTALNNIRLWPIVFLAFYLLTVCCLSICFNSKHFIALFVLVVVGLSPASSSFEKSRAWLEWNFSGVEDKAAAKDFSGLIETLKDLPAARISAESNGDNNFLFGSVRAFELIPALTQHEFVEGAIVNSARLPGIAYFLQCLTSLTCAGWPPGSLMPEFDPERAVSMMKSLGVTYHIANNDTFDWTKIKSVKVEKLFKGDFISLYKIGRRDPLVAVYRDALPRLVTEDPRFLILQLPRWDFFRETPFVILQASQEQVSDSELVNGSDFISYALGQWLAGDRVKDRGYSDRYSKRKNFRNMFLLSDWSDRNIVPKFFIADRPFDPGLLQPTSFNQNFKVYFDSRIAQFQPVLDDIDYRGFSLKEVGLGEFVFDIDWSEDYPQIDISSEEIPKFNNLVSTFPSKAMEITRQCNAYLKKGINKLSLFTDCPGKEHLIKYVYSENWSSQEQISLATNGFMVLRPKKSQTDLFWGVK